MHSSLELQRAAGGGSGGGTGTPILSSLVPATPTQTTAPHAQGHLHSVSVCVSSPPACKQEDRNRTTSLPHCGTYPLPPVLS